MITNVSADHPNISQPRTTTTSKYYKFMAIFVGQNMRIAFYYVPSLSIFYYEQIYCNKFYSFISNNFKTDNCQWLNQTIPNPIIFIEYNNIMWN